MSSILENMKSFFSFICLFLLFQTQPKLTMLRAMLASLAILSVASFELVSQSFEGTMTMTTSTPGVLFPKPATIKMGLDMDGTLKFGTSTHIVMDMPQYNTTTETKSSAIFDATTKRYTMYSEIITKSSSALPNPNPPEIGRAHV